MSDRRLRRPVSLPALLCTLATVLVLMVGSAPGVAFAAEPTVSVDIQIGNIYNFSPRDKTFNVVGTIWLTGADGASPAPVEFANLIQPWNSRIQPLQGKPEALTDGRQRRGYSFQGSFYSDQINFSAFPFGRLFLPVIVQPRPGMAVNLRAGHGAVGAWGGLNGYQLQGWTFGRVEQRLLFSVQYRSSRGAALMRWILPLAIVMLLMLLTPNLSSSLVSERLTIPPVVMLTIVFLQQSYREVLPNLPYLTAMDWLYNLSYLVTLVFFIHFMRAGNRIVTVPEAERAALLRRLDRWDLRLQLGSVGLYLLVALLAWRLQ